MKLHQRPTVTLLAGGVGAARLLRGLAPLVEPENLTVVVNTGDDDEFYGLHVSPDLDTIVYTLAGLAPRARGWGIRDDGYRALGALERFYGPAWFALGDRDLATHVFRTDRLRSGATLSQCTDEICRSLGVKPRILPATNARVRTVLTCDEGTFPFQAYLVKERARPTVRAVAYAGSETACAAPGVVEAIARADLVLIAPSNPFVSIGPMLAVKDLAAAVASAARRTVAVSPLIGGSAVKGPLAAMLTGMGFERSSSAIARCYRGFAETLVVSPGDRARTEAGIDPVLVEHGILLDTAASAKKLCRYLLTFAGTDEAGQASARA